MPRKIIIYKDGVADPRLDILDDTDSDLDFGSAPLTDVTFGAGVAVSAELVSEETAPFTTAALTATSDPVFLEPPVEGFPVEIQPAEYSGTPGPQETLLLELNGADVTGDLITTDGNGDPLAVYTYQVPASTGGQALTLSTSASNNVVNGSGDLILATASVSANVIAAAAPTALTAPEITGAWVGGTPSLVSAGTYDGSPAVKEEDITGTFTLDGVAFDPPTELQPADEGKTLAYVETASNGVSPDATQTVSETVAAEFDPALLFASGEAGLIYDVSDLSSMNTEPDQSGSVPAVGDPVRFIEDKSGNGNHATSSSLAASPVLRQDANSNYYLEFDGSDDFLDTGIFADAANDSVCIGLFIEDGTYSSNMNTMGATNASFANSFYIATWKDGTDQWGVISIRGGGEIQGSTGVKGNGPYVLSGVYQNSSTVEGWENGVSQGTASDFDTPTTTRSVYLGNFNRDGSPAPEPWLNGGIYGLIFQPGEAWNTAQREGVQEFIAGKSGVTL